MNSLNIGGLSVLNSNTATNPAFDIAPVINRDPFRAPSAQSMDPAVSLVANFLSIRRIVGRTQGYGVAYNVIDGLEAPVNAAGFAIALGFFIGEIQEVGGVPGPAPELGDLWNPFVSAGSRKSWVHLERFTLYSSNNSLTILAPQSTTAGNMPTTIDELLPNGMQWDIKTARKMPETQTLMFGCWAYLNTGSPDVGVGTIININLWNSFRVLARASE